MMKLLIVDDEPLVQIGLKSMISWEELGIEICGTASNGDSAYELICRHHPEIVITDIRMPCSSGLELAGKCREHMGRIPVFIILTSYEDFQYAKEAMKFQAVDYLVKIDLSPDSLTDSVKKAMEQVKLLKQELTTSAVRPDLTLFQERFYLCLLNNLFESRPQILQQAEDLEISFESAGYVVANLEFISVSSSLLTQEETLRSYHQTLQMFQELMAKYISCRIVPLDTQFLAIIFYIDQEHLSKWKDMIRYALKRTSEMLNSYYNVSFYISIGRMITDPLDLSVSYYDSRQIMSYLSGESPMIFWDDFHDAGSLRNVFNLYPFRNEISRAFEELDEQALHDIIHNLIEILSDTKMHFTQAMDVAGSILHLAMNLMDDGAKILSDIFIDEPDTYRSLYRQKSVTSIIEWLKVLDAGLSEIFGNLKNGHKNYLVSGCCQYIKEHIRERISVQDIADTFEVSPNYLSQLFKKHMGIGLNEYITTQKITESRYLLKESNMKIYEISDYLGFESAFYFSKVFKKTVGISPKDYRNQR